MNRQRGLIVVVSLVLLAVSFASGCATRRSVERIDREDSPKSSCKGCG